MEYRTLGKTGLSVSILGFGASPLGGVFEPIDEQEGVETVRAALDLGVNFFDVAPFYGLTKAETVLGKALQGVPRDRYILSTKVGRYGPAEFDFSAERVTRSVEESLQRLQVDYVDLIQCHDIEFVSLDQVAHEAIPALRKVVEQGKARFVGITGLPLNIYPYVLDRAPADVILSYCHYALSDTTLADLTPYLQEKGVGVINASPLVMGLLADRPLPAWHPAPEEMRRTCAKAAAHCRAKGGSLPKLALQFALAYPDVATTLVGMVHLQDLKNNVAWISEPIDMELLAEVQGILTPIKDQTWPSGLPENQ